MNKLKFLSLTAAALMLTACANEPVILEQDEYTEISLSWWGNDNRIEYTLEAIKQFEELHPDIRVKCSYTEWSGYQTRNKIYMASHTESDVMLINFAWLDQFSSDGSGYYDISTLGEYIDLSQFSESELEFGMRNGKLNAIPIALNTMTVYFNKSVYDSFGLEIPRTWEELFNAARVMDDEHYPMSMSAKSALFYTIAYTEQTTGKRMMTEDGKLNFNESDLAIMLDFYKKLVNENVIPQVEYFERNNLKEGSYGGVVAWLSDAGSYMGPAQEAGYEAVIGEYTSNAEDNVVWYTKPATMYAISSNTEHPKEAAILLDYLLNSPQISELQGIEKGIPLSRSSRSYLEEHDMLKGLQYEAFCRMNEHLDSMILINSFMESSDLLEAFQEAWNSVLYDKMSTEDKAAELYDTLTELLGK